MTLSLRGHYTGEEMLRETAPKEVSLEAAVEDRQGADVTHVHV